MQLMYVRARLLLYTTAMKSVRKKGENEKTKNERLFIDVLVAL